jgi:hypothetical protein
MGYDIDMIKCSLGMPVVFKDVSTITIAISFFCGRW